MSGKLPAVRVLLATHNGQRYLDAQLESILAQEGVDLEVLAADDASSDDTPAILQRWADRDPRITVIRRDKNTGGAAPSFYDLLLRAPADDRYVAFADQDDVWLPGKLARHAAILDSGIADAVSSNVTAFGDGKRSLVKKDYPQRRFDFLFEGPGPGCTHLMTPRLAEALRDQLRRPDSPARDVAFHDWLDYVVCRAAGWRWHIDAEPTVDYRQHGGNVFGANAGVQAAATRLGLMRDRWHRGQAQLLTEVALTLTGDGFRPELERIRELVGRTDFRARCALAAKWNHIRRRPRDRMVLGTLIAIGRW